MMIDVDVLLLSEVLDVPVEKLYMLSNNRKSRRRRNRKAYSNYHKVVIHRGRGHKNRILSVPNDFLKLVQRRILDRCLYKLEVSEYSTAYCKGKSLADNAAPHVGQEYVVKLDISHFFDSIDDYMVFMVLRQLKLSNRATSLLTNLCVYNCKLPQGAPTSPYIANLVMKHFDEKLGAWCTERNIIYTRYCDDMTFSGSKESMTQSGLTAKVRSMLCRMGFSLNSEKTSFISSSQQQKITGIVVNDKMHIPKQMKRNIRQEVYYCKKYGVSDSLSHRNDDVSPETYLHSLLGRISFVLQIEPDNSEMKEYFHIVKKMFDPA